MGARSRRYTFTVAYSTCRSIQRREVSRLSISYCVLAISLSIGQQVFHGFRLQEQFLQAGHLVPLGLQAKLRVGIREVMSSAVS